MRMASVISASCEALLPCLCLHCGGTIGGGQVGLCGACWSTVVPRAGSWCSQCTAPADDAADLCLTCQDNPPAHSGLIAWGEYDGALRSAVLGLKARGRDELAGPLGRRLAARISVEEWAADLEIIVAIPSHPLRRLRRGWPAAAVLAEVVGRELALPLRPKLRRRGMARQTGRSRAERSRMPRRTFRARGSSTGRRVLVVDDVTTTGTTLRRAAEVLLAAGAEAVYCAALAATPDGRSMT